MILRLGQHLARRWRVAFTLVEVVVAMAIVLILAAVALPALNGYLDQKSVESSATQLAIVRDAIYGVGGSFQNTVGGLPKRLSYLTTAIQQGDNNFLDSCGAQFTKKQAGNWNGPYVNFPIDAAAGMATPIGVAADTLTRTPVSATAGTLRINLVGTVEERYAQLLDDYVDGSNGSAAGIVQWTAAVNGQVTMYYYIAVPATC